MEVGDVIASLRKKKEITQDKFAKDLDVTVTYLSLIENNRKIPPPKLLKRVSHLLDVSVAELVFSAMKKKGPKSKKDWKTFKNVEDIVDSILTYMISEKIKKKKRNKKLGNIKKVKVGLR